MSARAGVLLVAAVALFNFAWMPGQFLDGDPAAWREEARSVALRGELSVPPEFAAKFFEQGQYFTHNELNGRWYSKYGVMNALVSLPPLWGEMAAGGDISRAGTYPSLLAFNLWNIVLSAILAGLLYALASLYTPRISVRYGFVLATLYCSALWFYLRAQSSELYQAVFFTALFLCLAKFFRTRGPGWLAAAWICAACLLLTRVSFGLLLPIIGALAWREQRKLNLWIVAPPVLALAALAYVNYVKFGSPLLTGYHQWRPEVSGFGGSLVDGLWGFLFAPRFSLFLHYPLLVLALFGAREFWQRHRADAIAMLAIFVPFLLVISKLPLWAGEYGYGPRYLLFLVPVLSLPAIVAFDSLIATRARVWAAVVAIALAYSTYLQVQVNRLGFWTYYEARSALYVAYTDAAGDWFRDRHVGAISADLLRQRADLSALPWFAEWKSRVPAEVAQGYVRELRLIIERGNWYWKRPTSSSS